MSESPVPEGPTAVPVQFRLVYVFYAISLLGSWLTLFGVGGALFGAVAVLPAIPILVFWGYVFSRRSRPRALLNACLVALVVGPCLIGLLWPARAAVSASHRRTACVNNLISLSLGWLMTCVALAETPPRDADRVVIVRNENTTTSHGRNSTPAGD
jgi:hypothetical protein